MFCVRCAHDCGAWKKIQGHTHIIAHLYIVCNAVLWFHCTKLVHIHHTEMYLCSESSPRLQVATLHVYRSEYTSTWEIPHYTHITCALRYV